MKIIISFPKVVVSVGIIKMFKNNIYFNTENVKRHKRKSTPLKTALMAELSKKKT